VDKKEREQRREKMAFFRSEKVLIGAGQDKN